MNSTITRALALLLVLSSGTRADTLAALRERLSVYLNDPSDLMVTSDTKDSFINVSQWEYAGMFPVHVDTATIGVDSGVRFGQLPWDFAGQVLSVHKRDVEFTEVKYIAGDSIPPLTTGVIGFYTQRSRILVFYPPPEVDDSVFVFYNALPDTLAAAGDECELLDYLEEPVLLLAASKIWLTADLRQDMADMFYQRFLAEASRLTRTELEVQQK